MIPPSNDAATETNMQMTQHVIQRLLKSTADKTLSTLASSCPKLNVLVLECTGNYTLNGFTVNAFLRSKQTDLYGHTTIVGVPVKPHMIKHYEPCSDILEPDRFVFA
jgi:hypothetical protein